MHFFDTHCHIQESQVVTDKEDATQQKWAKAGNPSADKLIANAQKAGVGRIVCVGCALDDSRRAVELAAQKDNVWASIGIHPHEAKNYAKQLELLEQFAALATRPKVVAIGECGLDYYYNNSSREAQAEILRFQIELALEHDLPMIFHVREAFDDFWAIFDQYSGIRGVVHSFTASVSELEAILCRGLYVGLNGIMTFTKNDEQLAAAKAVPLERLLLETDAPFLTPGPDRGNICEPKHVRVVAEFLANLRNEPLADLANITTRNARTLFDV